MKGRRGPIDSRRGISSHPPPPLDQRHDGGCPPLALPGEREHEKTPKYKNPTY